MRQFQTPVLLSLLASIGASASEGVEVGGGRIELRPPTAVGDDCVSVVQREAVIAARDRARLASGAAPRGLGLPRMRFHPQGGLTHRDLIVTNYVDLDPTAARLDWDCDVVTYDGHSGTDTVIRSFAEQAVGVPIFAAIDGVVIATDDGHPDMNTMWAGQPSNFVALMHDGGLVTTYFHLRNGSVGVGVGESVRAGEQIGLTASSGISTYPHLHLGVLDDGVMRDPYDGACNDAPASLWSNQATVNDGQVVFDAGVSGLDLATVPGPPAALPQTGRIATTVDPRATLWIKVNHLPAISTWMAKIYRPDGTVRLESSGQFGNASRFVWSWWFFSWNSSVLAGLSGTARFELYLNGVLEVVAPFEVGDTPDPDFNGPPAPFSARIVAAGAPIERAPTPLDVLRCELDVDLINDDPDYDVVRFEYVWTVDDVEVRRVTSAAHSDYLPAEQAGVGQLVRCAVVASDGNGGTSGLVEAIEEIRSPCPADTNGDRVVDLADLNSALSAFGLSSGVGGLPPDLNLDGVVSFADLNAILSAFGDECE
jgi:murein DD-endopeptidase MepM/ murein hydrolase activator NlpD